MENQNAAREQLLDLLRGGNAHIRFTEAIDHFPLELINAPLPGSDYTAWRLLEHMRIAQWDIVEFVRNPKHVSPPWPIGYWPPAGKKAGPHDWEQTIAAFHQDLDDMQTLAEDPQADLWAPIPHAPQYTIAREILTLADHNAYHLGEFGLLRQIVESGKTAT